jgi:hypothetical protein
MRFLNKALGHLSIENKDLNRIINYFKFNALL